jgi:lipoprotein-anchoring transpeptidase ErfK/SrfK
MKSQMKAAKLVALLVLKVFTLSAIPLAGQSSPAAHQQADSTARMASLAHPEPARVILVSLEDRRLALIEDGQVKKIYRVAVGKDSAPSPIGTFTIQDRVANPTYYHDGKVIPPGPENPVGTRWMGLSKAGYGIHGTNEPHSIGKAASHGCIRMSRRDLEDLFAQARAGDTVEIVGDRNDETAAIFGTPLTPAAPMQTLAAAQPDPATPGQTTAAAIATTAVLPAVIPVGQ